MKHLLTIAAFVGFCATANAQTSVSTTAAAIEEPATKEHVCSATCTRTTHAYMHGEKGHTCTEACKTASTTGTKAAGCCAGKKEGAACGSGAGKAEASAAHSCTDACKDGKHAPAHDEKGHATDGHKH